MVGSNSSSSIVSGFYSGAIVAAPPRDYLDTSPRGVDISAKENIVYQSTPTESYNYSFGIVSTTDDIPIFGN